MFLKQTKIKDDSNIIEPSFFLLKFGGPYINITIDDFNALGFSYGDSVDISFSNGYLTENEKCTINLNEYVEKYFLKIGMQEVDINEFKNKLTK